MGGKTTNIPGSNPYEVMDAAAQYNRINQYTPTGSVEFSGDKNNIATVTLTPEQQAILEGQQQLTTNALSQMLAMGGASPGGAGSIMGGPSFTGYGLESQAEGQAPAPAATAFGPLVDNMNALSLYLGGNLPRGGLNLDNDFSADRNRTEQAMFERAMGLIRPQQEARTKSEMNMLANRGIPESAKLADVYAGRRGRDFAEQENAAAYDAVLAGGEEQRAMRGMALTEAMQDLAARRGVRGDLFNELMQQYQFGKGEETEQFNRLAALLGFSQVNAPGAAMSGFWQPGQADATGAFSAAQNAYQMAQEYSPLNQALDLAGTLGGAALMGSSVEIKKDFEEVDYEDVLERLESIDVSRWRYIGEDGRKHVGPMAEDFSAAFGTPDMLPDGTKAIDVVSAFGVALAAIKALTARVKQLEAGGE